MSSPRFRRFVAVLVTACAVVASLLITTGTASATSACRTSSKTFETWWGDVNIDVQLCVYAENGRVWADAVVYWDRLVPPPADQFYKFEFNLRLEYQDDVRTSRGCYPVNAINNNRSGSYGCPATPQLTYSGGRYWTADADVRYNINGDTQDDLIWPLTGTPPV